MKTEWKFFYFITSDAASSLDSLDILLKEGWEPIRETALYRTEGSKTNDGDALLVLKRTLGH